MRKQLEIEENTIEKGTNKTTLPPKHPSGVNPSISIIEETSPSTSRESSIKAEVGVIQDTATKAINSNVLNESKTPQQNVSNIENTKVLLEQLKDIVDDAVFLDDDSFNGMKTISYYNQKLQASQKRIKLLSQQLLAAQSQLAKKDEKLMEAREVHRMKDAKISELTQQIENNAVVFKMHFNQLLQYSEEIERLKAIIEGLSGGSSNT